VGHAAVLLLFAQYFPHSFSYHFYFISFRDTQQSGRGNTRRRAAAGGGPGAAGGGSSNILQFYKDDSPGLQVGPTTVLVASLSFVGIVVLLHIWGKFRM
jgi:protein transport protein SEC61 subunit beta